jgi:WD40 repeat protein
LRPDGRVLAVGGADSTLELWAVDDPSAPRRLGRAVAPLLPNTIGASTVRVGGQGIEDVAFTPDGRTVVIGGIGTPNGQGGLVSLYDVTDPAAPRHVARLGDYRDVVDRVALSPDGAHLATGGWRVSGDGAHVVLWNITDPAHPVEESRVSLPLNAVNALRFDGTALTAVGFAQKAGPAAVSWDIADPAHPVRRASFGDDRTTAQTLVTSGKRWLVTGGTAKDLAGWDTADPDRPRETAKLDGHRGGVITVDRDATAQMLVTSGVDRTVRVWDVSAPAGPTLVAAIPWSGGTPVTAIFDPVRPRLLVLDKWGTVRVWDTTELAAVVRDPIGVACATLSPGPSAGEWSGKLDPTFSRLPC